jgi:hypothetical protein
MKMEVRKRLDDTLKCEIIVEVQGKINNSEMSSTVGMIYGKNCER